MKTRSVAAIVAAVALVGATAWIGIDRPWQHKPTAIAATDPAVQAAEAARRVDGSTVREFDLTAAPTSISLGDRSVDTWAFNGTVPGPEIRVQRGDTVRVHVRNSLPAELTIHWHGITLRNDMDGVVGVTQDAIQPGMDFTYEFIAPDAGTYFYHPHTGTQLDRGLYAPLIVEDRQSSTPAVDHDIPILLDDWIDGTGQSPDDVLRGLKGASSSADHHSMHSMDMDGMKMGGSAHNMDMSAMGNMPSRDNPLGTDTGDVNYPLYLINGHTPTSPAEHQVAAGSSVRLRLINAGSDTPFRVAVGGTKMSVVATDGYDVDPVPVDTLIIGMGERYDVLVTLPGSGVYPLVAKAEGKDGGALAVLRSGAGASPAANVSPSELQGKLLTLADLHATRDLALAPRAASRTYDVALVGSMSPYEWSMKTPDEDDILDVRQGDPVRLTITNQSMMWHPIHLHGHTFQVDTGNGVGPRKDTVDVAPMQTVTIEFDADNPGQWMLHCHNIYHAEAGMMAVISYVR